MSKRELQLLQQLLELRVFSLNLVDQLAAHQMEGELLQS